MIAPFQGRPGAAPAQSQGVTPGWIVLPFQGNTKPVVHHARTVAANSVTHPAAARPGNTLREV